MDQHKFQELWAGIDSVEDKVLGLMSAYSALVFSLVDAGIPIRDSLLSNLADAANQFDDDPLPGAASFLDELRAFFAEELKPPQPPKSA